MDGITNSSSMTWDMVDMSCIGRRHSAGASNIYQNFSMEFASEIFLITGLYEFSIGVNMEARFGTALMSMCENVKLRSETWHCEGVKQWNGWISKVSCMVTVFKVNKFVPLIRGDIIPAHSIIGIFTNIDIICTYCFMI